MANLDLVALIVKDYDEANLPGPRIDPVQIC